MPLETMELIVSSAPTPDLSRHSLFIDPFAELFSNDSKFTQEAYAGVPSPAAVKHSPEPTTTQQARQEGPKAKRPKLSLQTNLKRGTAPLSVRTSNQVSNLENICQGKSQSPFASDSSADTFSGSSMSEFSDEDSPPSSVDEDAKRICSRSRLLAPYASPYKLPLGVRSILKNSPVPKRAFSCTSISVSRRVFRPVKRVSFRECVLEIPPVDTV